MLQNGSKLRSIELPHRQNNTSTITKRWDTLGREFLTLWQQAHGAPQGVANAMAVQYGVTIFIENAFSQAELALTRQSTDNLLEQYIDSLTRQILPVLASRVERITCRQVGATGITSNIEQNWMLVFIKFGEPIPSEGKS